MWHNSQEGLQPDANGYQAFRGSYGGSGAGGLVDGFGARRPDHGSHPVHLFIENWPGKILGVEVGAGQRQMVGQHVVQRPVVAVTERVQSGAGTIRLDATLKGLDRFSV